MRSVKVSELIKDLNLKVLAGEKGINAVISDDELSTPGMEFAGFFSYFEPSRLIVIGSKESTYLNELKEDVAYERVEQILSQHVPAIIVSKRVKLPKFFLDLGNKYDVTILKSEDRTSSLNSKLYLFLRDSLAERISVHGVLMDINGLGTLIIGKSGIGKSEVALELVKRGHQLVADDLVEIYEKEIGVLSGKAPDTIKKYIEVRGVGIVNVVEMFGVAAYRERKTIRLVIELKEYKEGDTIDRLGLEEEHVTFFNTELPKITIPVMTGRNIAILVEAASLTAKLKNMGYNACKELMDNIGKISRGEEK